MTGVSAGPPHYSVLNLYLCLSAVLPLRNVILSPKVRQARVNCDPFARCNRGLNGTRRTYSADAVESRSGAVADAPFPLPARRTGQAVFPHPALGQDVT